MVDSKDSRVIYATGAAMAAVASSALPTTAGWVKDSGQMKAFSSLVGLRAAKMGTAALLLTRRHMLARG